MTDREPGAPDDPLPADDTYGELFQDDASATDGTETEAEDGTGADQTDEAEEADDTDVEDEADEEADEGADADAPVWEPAVLGAKAGSSAEVRRGGRAEPSVAERAVHLSDRASAIFVVAIVLTFVGILLYGMLAGSAGFFTPLATPGPTPTEEPIPSDSLEPSAEPSGSPSAAPSGSGTPSGSPSSAAPSGSPSAPAGSPSASPSGSPSPAAS